MRPRIARFKFTAEIFSAARNESGELSKDGHRPSKRGPLISGSGYDMIMIRGIG